jgi:predicted dehydrogenase
MKHKIGIIGAGRMAAGFDSPGDELVLTHAHAVIREPRLELAGFWDINNKSSQEAAVKWGGQSYRSLETLLQNSDMIVVAVPDDVHETYLKILVEYTPRLVICEKPLTKDIESAQSIVRIFAEHNIPLLVNFQRRFDPMVIEVRRLFCNNELGRIIGGTVWYSKGTKHNGSHAVDLLRFLFGEPVQLHAYAYTMDFTEDDPTVSARMDFGLFSINLIAADERLYSIFEIDLVFEKARYRFTHSGLDVEIQKPQKDPVFAGYTELAVVQTCMTGLSHSLEKLLNASADYLDGGALPTNSAEDALKTQKICNKLVDLALAQKLGTSCLL